MTSLYAPSSDDVKQRLRPFGFFFEKSLKDLIRGIRSHNDTPEKLDQFLADQLSECREEVNSSNLDLKTNAVLKLTYLEMYGFDMSWCNFHILEVMSSSKLQHKRVGYLAASHSFNKDADVLILATNLLKKDLKYAGGNDVYKVGIALSGLSTIVTPELAMDIVDDLFMMLNSSKPYIRKKTITALFKVFLEYPEALRDHFDEFVSKLEDDDSSVVSATVSVICELSKKNAKPFIRLSPLLYEILVTVDNNWIIIRLLKLFTNLSKVEPKLKLKLVPKIMELMDSTMATSVLYESINCIISGNMLDESDFDVAIQCLDRLNTFCDSQDPNLRYISCVLFYKIGKINTDFISQYEDLIMQLISDVDVSIRSKAIELLNGIVSEDNLRTIVNTLMKQIVNEETVVLQTNRAAAKEIPIVIPDSYKRKFILTIIDLCTMDNYNNIPDFEWYNAVLYDLTIISQDLADVQIGTRIGDQLRNLMIRVPDMRNITITTIIKILSVESIDSQLPSALNECIWSLGEYSNYIENGDALILSLIKKGLKYKDETQSTLVISLLKIFNNWCNSKVSEIQYVKDLLYQLVEFLDKLAYSKSFEVQEISVQVHEILKLSLEAMPETDTELPLLLTEVIPSFFNRYELTPIAPGTQKQLPQGIDFDMESPFITKEELDQILDAQQSHTEETVDIYDSDRFFADNDNDSIYEHVGEYEDKSSDDDNNLGDTYKEFDEEESVERNRERLSNPFYLGNEHNKSDRNNVSDLLSDDRRDDIEKEPSFVVLANKPLDISNGASKKKKKRSKRVMVLSDQVIVIPGAKESETKSNSSLSPSPTPNSNRISLKKHSKLEDFQFDDSVKAINEEDEEELEKLRSKFAAHSIEGYPKQELDDVNEEEVVIIKRKKKSKSKSDSEKKDKKKKKKNSKREPTDSEGVNTDTIVDEPSPQTIEQD